MPGVMSHVGLLTNGDISIGARVKFVDDVIGLLNNGTSEYMFGSLPDSLIFSGDDMLASKFDVKPIDEHMSTFPKWHDVFIDTMFKGVASAFDINCGGGQLAPFGDPTVAFPDIKLASGLTISEFVTNLALLPASLPKLFDIDEDFLIEFTAKFPGGLLPPNVPAPEIPFVPPPTLPTVEVPIIEGIKPSFDIQALPTFMFTPPIPPSAFADIKLPLPVLGFVTCAMLTAIPSILTTLLTDVDGFTSAITKGPVGLITFVSSVVIGAISGCLGIVLSSVLTFTAGFLVYINRLVLMLIVLTVGMLFGQGLLVKLVATSIGLV